MIYSSLIIRPWSCQVCISGWTGCL